MGEDSCADIIGGITVRGTTGRWVPEHWEKLVLKDGGWANFPLEKVVLEFSRLSRMHACLVSYLEKDSPRGVPGLCKLHVDDWIRADPASVQSPARLRNIKEPLPRRDSCPREACVLGGEDRPNKPTCTEEAAGSILNRRVLCLQIELIWESLA